MRYLVFPDAFLPLRFRAFGPLRYARVTMDHDSGRSRGTGFVSFWNLADAEACIEEADRMRDDLDVEVRISLACAELVLILP